MRTSFYASTLRAMVEIRSPLPFEDSPECDPRVIAERETALRDRERQYARAEAAAAIVKTARRWYADIQDQAVTVNGERISRHELQDAIQRYETLVAGES